MAVAFVFPLPYLSMWQLPFLHPLQPSHLEEAAAGAKIGLNDFHIRYPAALPAISNRPNCSILNTPIKYN
jgi:hypothetical protein